MDALADSIQTISGRWQEAEGCEPPIPRLGFEAAEVKRFFERWSADPSFRALALADPPAAAEACNVGIDPQSFRQQWDSGLPENQHHPLPPAAEEYFENNRLKFAFRDRMVEECRSDNPRLGAWRERQIARGQHEVGKTRMDQIVHAPFAIELNVGCSVGCWFCGISAPKMTEVFRYTPDNRTLWREVISALGSEIGAAAQWGFCYWATDPFDNPDYEQFLVDFHAFLGRCPQTTTALPLRDPVRTRRLLRLTEQLGCYCNRFSILSLRNFKAVHAEFSAAELRAVECIPQNKESVMNFANSGRARERGLRKATLANETPTDPPGTIACVSGFLINMVQQNVKLISPCRATDRWPLGYIVFDEAVFSDGEELQRAIRRMIDQHMPDKVTALPRIAFADGLEYLQTADGFELNTQFRKSRHEHREMAPLLKALGELIADGTHDAETIGLLLEYHGLPSQRTESMLQTLMNRGLLREGPALKEA